MSEFEWESTANHTNTISGSINLTPVTHVLSIQECVNILHCNLRYSLSWTIVLFVAYLVVFVIGLFGNLSVLWIVGLLKRETNRRYSCIASTGIMHGPVGQVNSNSYSTAYTTKSVMINISRSNLVFYRFVCNLALADLLVVLFCLPPTLIGNIYFRKFPQTTLFHSNV